MKRYFLYIFHAVLAALMLTGCQDGLRTDNDDNGDCVKMRVGINMPQAERVLTKAMSDMTDDKRKDLDLWLFVFDESGLFVEAAQATPVPVSVSSAGGSKTNQDDETLFDVVLTKTKKGHPRIIHFVAYYDAEMKDKVVNLSKQFGTETSMMPTLQTEGTQDAYWKRLTGVEVNKENAEGLFKRVPLVRNFAEVSVTEGASLTNFEFEGFCICNKPDKGHVVAYNENGGYFMTYDKGTLGAEVSKDYDELLNEDYKGFAPAMTYTLNLPPNTGNDSYFSTEKQYLYETPNADGSARGRTYLIIKGRYNGHASSYYKVDIVRKGDYGTEFYNVLRNTRYLMSINSVTSNGYATPAEAAEHAASNNLSTSVATESVTNISDGQQRLFVNNTFFCFTEDGENLEIQFKYMGPHMNGSTEEASYTYSTTGTPPSDYKNWSNKFISWHVTGDSAAVFAAAPEIILGETATDWCTVKLQLKTPVQEPQTVQLRLYVNQQAAQDDEYLASADKALYAGEIMSRDITIVLRQRYQWYIDCPASVEGTDLAVNLLLPTSINQQLFPLAFYIEPEAKSIYPDTDPASTIRSATGMTAAQIADSALHNPSINNNVLAVRTAQSIIPGNDDLSFQYEKILTWEEYQQYTARKRVNGTSYMVVPLYFKTNTSVSATWVYGEAKYFTEGAKDQFTNDPAVFDDNYAGTVTTSSRLGKGHEVPITFKLLTVPTNGLTVTVTEGSTVNTYTIDAADLVVGENTFTYTTQTFKERNISAEVSTNTGNVTEQTYQPNSDNKRRRYLYLPQGTFDPQLWLWEKHDGDSDYTLYQSSWVVEAPSLFLLKDGDPDDDLHWIDCGWFNLDATGLRAAYELDIDRPIYKPTNQQGITISENDVIKMVGWNNPDRQIRAGDYIRIGDLSDAYAAGGNSNTNGTGSIVAKFTDSEKPTD